MKPSDIDEVLLVGGSTRIPKVEKLVKKIFGKSNYGNTDWEKASFEWYEGIHDENTKLHENFIEFLEAKRKSIQTILEVDRPSGGVEL